MEKNSKLSTPQTNGANKCKKKKVIVYTKKKKPKKAESVLIQELQAKYESIQLEAISSFDELPLSSQTLKGLHQSNYTKPTEIQLQTLKYSLKGEDILGAAHTGSGKTLAFLIPTLEILFCHQWTQLDGVGALVITPTRELAYQIFEELKKIGASHDFSAGLIIGGKDLKFERARMHQCNIMICTPGRLLQHMDENPLFNCDNMQVLVLDEADRILDLGFADSMNAIIANLPSSRQTLLFSATQTKSVKDLARLSLKEPRYIAVHEHKDSSTPSALEQSFMICELHEKISVLFSFMRNHLKAKTIIFVASCKQAKYLYEIFCKLRPGVSLMALYGSLHQLRRMEIYEGFCKKTHAVLFATDLAARGLDFPQVNWVVQADCPEDPQTYIHRVGRTARYHRGGESLLLLLPSETSMLEELSSMKIQLDQIHINPDKITNPVRKMEAYLAKDPQLKDSAQRAFKSYFKSVYLMKNKKVFNVRKLNPKEFAGSLGLAVAPRIRFLEKIVRKDGLKVNHPHNNILPANNITKFASDDEDIEAKERMTLDHSDNSDSDEDMLQIKRANHDIDMSDSIEDMEMMSSRRKSKPITKAALVRKLLNKQIVANKKVVFDEDGEAIVMGTKQKQSGLAQEYDNEEQGGIDIERAKEILREEDQFDKQLFKERVRTKKKEAKRKLKEEKMKNAKIADDSRVDQFDEDDGSEPDLDWLPDPDKVFAGSQSNEQQQVASDNEAQSAPEDQPPCKRKKKTAKLQTVADSLNVNEAEQLALMLLRK